MVSNANTYVIVLALLIPLIMHAGATKSSPFGDSSSGYIQINETTGSNMFYWLFPSQEADAKIAPLILWLEGGPGMPGTFQIAAGMGPYRIVNNTLVPNEYTWNVNCSLLFVDNPVGVGFSFTNTSDGIPQSADEVARDLYIFLVEFYERYPQYLQVMHFFFSFSPSLNSILFYFIYSMQCLSHVDKFHYAHRWICTSLARVTVASLFHG